MNSLFGSSVNDHKMRQCCLTTGHSGEGSGRRRLLYCGKDTWSPHGQEEIRHTPGMKNVAFIVK